MSTYFKIRCKDITKDHLKSGWALFVPGLNSSIIKLDDGTYHHPMPSGPQTLEETLQFCHTWNPDGHFWIFIHSDQQEQEFLNDPIWSIAKPAHKGKLTDEIFWPKQIRCDCCDTIVGYGIQQPTILCYSCCKNCYDEPIS